MKLASLLLLALCSTVHGQPAPAPTPNDPVERAKALYAEGKRYYDLGDYGRAIETWKKAYVLSAAPMLLFNIAQAHRLSGDCPQALKVYASYEREAKDVTNRDELETAKERCNREPTTTNPPVIQPGMKPIEPSPPTGGTATGGSSGSTVNARTTPSNETTVIDAGATGSTATGAGGAAATGSAAIDTVPTRVRTADAGGTLRLGGLISGGVGAVALTASVVYALRSSDRASAVEGFRGEWGPAQQQLERDGKSARTRSIVTAVVGGLALVGGGAMYLAGSSRRHHQIEVAATATSAEVQWHVSF